MQAAGGGCCGAAVPPGPAPFLEREPQRCLLSSVLTSPGTARLKSELSVTQVFGCTFLCVCFLLHPWLSHQQGAGQQLDALWIWHVQVCVPGQRWVEWAHAISNSVSGEKGSEETPGCSVKSLLLTPSPLDSREHFGFHPQQMGREQAVHQIPVRLGEQVHTKPKFPGSSCIPITR